MIRLSNLLLLGAACGDPASLPKQEPAGCVAASEVPYDGVDQDCDGLDLVDVDGDGWAGGPSGEDCDDADAARRPDAEEVCDGAVDEDCDGLVDEGSRRLYSDADGDGYGDPNAPIDTVCEEVPGYVTEAEDCDDSHTEANPAGVEVGENGLDDDCDGWADPGTAVWSLGDRTLEVDTTLLVGRLDLGAAAADPTSLVVDAGLAGSAAVDVDGSFRLTVNRDATSLLRVRDADGNIIALRAIPLSARLLGPGEVTIDHDGTIAALWFLTPGLVTSDPLVAGPLLGLFHGAEDPAQAAAARDALEAALAADPAGLGDPPVEVLAHVAAVTDTLMEALPPEARMRPAYAEAVAGDPPSAVTYTNNGLFAGAGADTADVDVALEGESWRYASASIRATNNGFRWVSLYLDPDDTNTNVVDDGDSEWLGLIPAREYALPGPVELVWDLVLLGLDAGLSGVVDPSGTDVLQIYEDHWEELLDSVDEAPERTWDYTGAGALLPYRTGRVFIAGPGHGAGTEAGDREALPAVATVLTQGILPFVEVVVGVADLVPNDRLADCSGMLTVSVPLLDDLVNVEAQLSEGRVDEAWTAFQELLAALLVRDELWECAGAGGLDLPSVFGAAHSLTPLRWADVGSAALSWIVTWAGLLHTVGEAPEGASYALSIVDRDEDLAIDHLLDGDDCDDLDAAISPDATETCDDVDNDCDGLVDDEDPSVAGSAWPVDADGDGFGDLSATVVACELPGGAAADATDCDDSDGTVYPGAVDTCDGVDQDCSGADDGCPAACEDGTDDDADGWVDLDDPGCADSSDDDEGGLDAALECNDGLDNDGDGAVDVSDPECRAAGALEDGTGGWATIAATSPDTTLGGGGYFEGLGGYAPLVTDLDDDGASELIVGSPYAGASSTTSPLGGVYVYESIRTSAGVLTGSVGGATCSAAGTSLAVGDLDGDLAPDLVIGAPGSCGAFGAAYVLPSGMPTASLPLSSAAATVQAASLADNAGHVVVVGDLDGDTQDDLAIAANGSSGGRGVLHLFQGPLSGTVDFATPDSALTAGPADYGVGYTLAIGDPDGDGISDLAASAYDTAANSTVYVLAGDTPSGSTMADAGACIQEASGPVYLGLYGLAFGDVDGDGAVDLAISAPYDDTLATNGGAIYLFLSPIAGTITTEDATAVLAHDGSQEYAGQALAVGDVDGDSVADVAVGAPSAAASGGLVMVQQGPFSGQQDLADADVWIVGSGVEATGTALAIGDLDDDGLGDLVYGMPGWSPSGYYGGSFGIFYFPVP